MKDYEDNNDDIETASIHVLPELVSDDSDVESMSVTDVESMSSKFACGRECYPVRHKLKEDQPSRNPEVTETTEVQILTTEAKLRICYLRTRKT
jgi:hypothetical protein